MVEELALKYKERGQSMVELALTITFLMILLAGTIDLGRGFFTWLAMRDAAQEGASYGSFNPDNTTQIRNRVWDNLEQVISNPALNVTVDIQYSGAHCLSSDPNNQNAILVDVGYPNFTLTMPFLGTIIGSQVLPIHAIIRDSIVSPACNP